MRPSKLVQGGPGTTRRWTRRKTGRPKGRRRHAKSSAAGTTTVQGATGPDVLKPAAEQAVRDTRGVFLVHAGVGGGHALVDDIGVNALGLEVGGQRDAQLGDVGAIADQAARKLTKDGAGTMYCLAGIGAGSAAYQDFALLQALFAQHYSGFKIINAVKNNIKGCNIAVFVKIGN